MTPRSDQIRVRRRFRISLLIELTPVKLRKNLKALANGFNICFNILSILLNGNVESVCHPPSTLLKRVERMLNRC